MEEILNIEDDIQDEPWSLHHNGRKICQNIDSTIREVVHSAPALDYWVSRGRFDADTIPDIDWIAVEKGILSLTPTRRNWVSKHAAGICGVNKCLKDGGCRIPTNALAVAN